MNYAYKLWPLALLMVMLLVGWTGNARAPKVILVPENYPTIRGAINEASEGDIILVGPGTYQENIVIQKGLYLQGANAEFVTLKSAEKNKPVVLLENEEQQDVTIEGVSITGATIAVEELGQVAHAYGIASLGNAKLVVKDSRIFGNDQGGILLESAGSAKIQACEIFENGEGIAVAGATDIVIEHSSIRENRADGLTLVSFNAGVVQNNEIASNWGCGIHNLSENRLAGAANQLLGNGASLCGNVDGELRKPLRTASKDQIRFPDAEYPSLQEAVDALRPGGELLLQPGQYVGGLTIDKPLRVRGMGAVELKLEDGSAPVLSLINGSDVTITGVQIRGGRIGVELGGSASAAVDQGSISGNYLGILAQHSARGVFRNISFSENTFTVLAGNQADISFSRNTFTQNQWLFSILDFAHATISDNMIEANSDGIRVGGSAEVAITGNTLTNNSWEAIDIGGQAKVSVRNNVIASNVYHGIWVWGSAEVAIEENKIYENGNAGLVVGLNASVRIFRNEIHDNEYMGIMTFIKDCWFEYGADAFLGHIAGSGNKVYDNDWGEFCPWSLSFLATEQGGEYP